jgi:hypothetical protein
MKKLYIQVFLSQFLLLYISTLLFGQKLYEQTDPMWKPIKDDVYLQEVAKKIHTKKPVQSIAQLKGDCYAVVEGQVYVLKDSGLLLINDAPSGVNKLINLDDALWALAKDGIYQNKKDEWKKIDNQEYVDICIHQEKIFGATREELYRLENSKFISAKPDGGYLSSDVTMLMEDGTQLHVDPVRIGPIEHIQSYNGTLYFLRPGKLVLFDGQIVNTDHIDWGTLPSKETRDLLSNGSKLFVSTDRGLGVLRGAALTVMKGKDGLPYENTTCLEKGFDNDIWIGTTKGAVRMLDDDWHYFGADHWLPGNGINGIAVGDNIVYIATDKGIGVIQYVSYTLQKKAAYYERHLEEWGHKRMGFVHTIYKKDGEWIRHNSDNDGGHTSPYLAAMSFKYAVTGDEEARQNAVESFRAMLWLERITPIDGYVARGIWSESGDQDELSKHGSGGLPAKWHKASDGDWYWKGDTSSDEVIAHFYSVSIFHDLVAKGKEKDLAREHLAKIASYILECGWLLKGMDGKPTRWGRWDPQYLLRPYGYMDRGINGLEALTFMRTALALTGEQKFADGYQQLVKWGYPQNTIRQKNVFPPSNIAPWDDNLAFRSYYTLLRYTDNPIDRSVYLRSLARTYEVKRIEQVSWYNFSYGAITGNDCEQSESLKHLQAWQLDCIGYNFINSDRNDLFTPDGYVSYERGIKAISPREREVTRNSRYAMVQDGGQNGNNVMEPSAFIRDYWMGRYHGFIEAPSTKDANLISVKPRTDQSFGAKPYAGPKMPNLY